jgi:hypothetical protein
MIMMKRFLARPRRSLGILALAVFVLSDAASAAAQSQTATKLPGIGEQTTGLTRFDGFFDLYWSASTGRLYWEIDRWEKEFLYQVSLGSGLGSNPVGLDRGQLGGTYVLKPLRVGPRVLLIEPNYGYRARSDNPDEVRAVRDAFAPSIQWGFAVVAETDGRVLVDATDFFLRDTHQAARRLESSGQGSYQLDLTRSAFYLPQIKGFPKNTEVETLLTFTTAKPGPLVSSVSASGESVTLRQHHSLVELPDDRYKPREVDPRVGTLSRSFYDFASPIDQPLQVEWAVRHRLTKKDPRGEKSEPVAPIVYYVDRGIPEPIRSAVIEGAAWWNEAFEAAGFIDAFRVEMLPEGADPQDIRYHMIHWTHRSTRGWSYGGAVVDPRTGEIMKGNVNLGSLRLRQDYLLGQGLTASFPEGPAGCGLAAAPSFEYLALVGEPSDPVGMALARVRQLSAHEVGHTLGFPHNYIASAYGRESVMDYPAPLVEITPDGKLDLSKAYAARIGAYDKLSVDWLYREFPPGTDEKLALGRIVEEGLKRGLRYMGHTDNAFTGAGHELASVWDNGDDLVKMLRHEVEVRRIGLEGFGPRVIRPGQPLWRLEEVLVPLYLHHRFQLTSAVQSLGGADYRYALRGDGQTPIRIVPGAKQREALEAVLSTLSVDFLAVPERILQVLPPGPEDAPRGELFDKRTGLTFDALGVVAIGAQFTVSSILHPERMARLVEFGSRGDDYPDLDEVSSRLLDATWSATAPTEPYRAEVLNTVQRVVLDELMAQASSSENTAPVRARLTARLSRLAAQLEAVPERNPHQDLALSDIRRWQNRPLGVEPPSKRPAIPAGSPIGQGVKPRQ